MAAFIVFILLGFATVIALTGTQAGSRWVLNKAFAGLNDEHRSFTYGSARGTLLWGITLRDLHYQEGDNAIHVGGLELLWDPSMLLARSLSVERAVINDLAVTWRAADTPDTAEPFSDPLAGILPLPLAINIRFAALRTATISINDSVQQLASLQFSARLQERELLLGNVMLDSELIGVQGELEATLAPPYSLRSDLQWQWQQALPTALTMEQPQGALHLAGDLNSLIINHQLQTPLRLDSDGNAVLDLFPQGTARTRTFSIVHQLPPQTAPQLSTESELSIQIDDAEFTTSGWIDSLHVAGVAAIRLLDVAGVALAPPLGLSWNTLVDTQGVTLEQLGASTPSGSFSGSGEVRWRDGLALDIDFSLREDDASQYQA
ncbi:MAG: hypothetical protein ACRER5_17950, partial [Pseudomonas sp.]